MLTSNLPKKLMITKKFLIVMTPLKQEIIERRAEALMMGPPKEKTRS
jgi:hypothetical protein